MKALVLFSLLFLFSACNSGGGNGGNDPWNQNGWPHGKASRVLTQDEKLQFGKILSSIGRAESVVSRMHTPETKSNDEQVEKMFQFLKNTGCAANHTSSKAGEKTISEENITGQTCAIKFNRHTEATVNQRITTTKLDTLNESYKQLNDVHGGSYQNIESMSQTGSISNMESTASGMVLTTSHNNLQVFGMSKSVSNTSTNKGRAIGIIGIEMPFGTAELTIMVTSDNGKLDIKAKINGEDVGSSPLINSISQQLILNHL